MATIKVRDVDEIALKNLISFVSSKENHVQK